MKLTETQKESLMMEKFEIEDRLARIDALLLPIDADCIGKCFYSEKYGHIYVKYFTFCNEKIQLDGIRAFRVFGKCEFGSEMTLILTAKEFIRANFKEETFDEFQTYFMNSVKETLSTEQEELTKHKI